MAEEVEILIKANENSEFLNRNFKRLQGKYPNRVIAIKNRQVIGIAKDVDSLVKGIPARELGSVLVASILPKGTAYIL